MNLYTLLINGLGLLLVFVACDGQEREETTLLSGYTEVCFTAGTVTPTKAGEALTENGRVSVYVWQNNETPSETNRFAYSNTYTIHTENSTTSLAEVGGKMQVPVANGYRFYALSGNSSLLSAPVLNTAHHSETLQNGVDYLMAVNDNSNNGFNVTGDALTVPFVFRHIATRIVLNVKPGDTNGYTSADGLSVAIAAIDSTGSYIDLSATWDASSSKDMIYWETGGGLQTGGMALDHPDGQCKTAEGSDNRNFTVSFILLPVADASRGIPLQLNFSGITFATGGKQERKTYTALLKGQNGGELILKGGSTYMFEASISRYHVAFTLPKVAPWVVDGVGLDEVIEIDPTPGN